MVLNQILEVVNLTVTDENDGTVLVFENEGLVGVKGVVHDRETMKADNDILIGFKIGIIGTAMGQLMTILEPFY